MTEDNERRLVDLMMERLDQQRPWPASQPAPQPATSNVGQTFTIQQIASALFALITVGGTLFAAWYGLTNKIETQKVSSDLIIEQIHKDISDVRDNDKEVHIKIDSQVLQTQTSIKDLSNRLDELDSTVNQLYSRTSNQKNNN